MAREKEGQFIALTQAQYPKLAAVRPQLQPTTDGKMELHITAPDMSPIIVQEELPPSSTTTIVRYIHNCMYISLPNYTNEDLALAREVNTKLVMSCLCG